MLTHGEKRARSNNYVEFTIPKHMEKISAGKRPNVENHLQLYEENHSICNFNGRIDYA